MTTNPDNGNYMVTSMDDAQKTRFITVNMKFDIDVWARWAEKAGIDGRCINFLMLHPELVTEKINARAITTFFNSISSIEKFEENLPLIQMIGEGSVGSEFATLFSVFINNKLDKMITPMEILFNDNESYIIGALSTCIGKDADYRADIASILTTRVINTAINYADKNTVNDKLIARITKLATDNTVITDEIGRAHV